FALLSNSWKSIKPFARHRIVFLLSQSEKFSSDRLPDIKGDINISVPEQLVANEMLLEPSLKKRKHDPNSVTDVPLPVSASRAMLMQQATVPCNKHLVELIDTVKPCIRELIDHANLIKMWIAYLIPRIEDGNNFGVSVQEDTLSEARQVESEAATYLDQISRYFITRGKVISKIAKYPHVEDYRRTVIELDEKEFISMRLVLCELRNQYSSLHDLIIKNLDKIKKPRNANTDNMY
ncbi:hypothetical protein NP493_59g00003, partial [Ridgeia piscesae]